MISIIIPLYNKEHCIRETLFSVLSQSYKDFEIVIVNDGSKDSSKEVVESIKDSRIRLINKENEGVSKARNRGIKEAKGEWILFLDADDLMCEGCLQALVDLSDKYPQANILSGNFITRTDKEDIYASMLKEVYVIENPFELIWKKKWNMRLGSFISKKEITPMFAEHMSKGEDVLFCFDLISNNSVAFTPHIAMIYLRENSSLSKQTGTLEGCMSWNISFEGVPSYLKTIYMDTLVKGIVTTLFWNKRVKNGFRLIAKHFISLCKFTPMYICRKLIIITKVKK